MSISTFVEMLFKSSNPHLRPRFLGQNDLPSYLRTVLLTCDSIMPRRVGNHLENYEGNTEDEAVSPSSQNAVWDLLAGQFYGLKFC